MSISILSAPRIAILFFSLIIVLPECNTSSTPVKLKQTRLLMDTFVEITVIHNDKKKGEEAIESAFDEMERIERLMSRFIEDSDISRLNKNAGQGPQMMNREVYNVIKKAVYYSEITGGRFDITVGVLMDKVWRFDNKDNILPGERDIKRLLPLVDYRKIRLAEENMVSLEDKGMMIDVGGIAKGYAVDKGMEVLIDRGIHNAIINAGGDLKAIGKREEGKLWRIGIQHPRKPSEILGVLEVSDISIATSGDYQKYFIKGGKRYHHIIDPHTGWPAMKSESVTITARNVTDADAIATAVFVMGPDDGMKFIEKMDGIEGLIVTSDGKKSASSGLSVSSYANSH